MRAEMKEAFCELRVASALDNFLLTFAHRADQGDFATDGPHLMKSALEEVVSLAAFFSGILLQRKRLGCSIKGSLSLGGDPARMLFY